MRQSTITTDERSYVILLQPEPEGGYTVTCPALPGLVTYGEMLEEARVMAADAISGYFACLRDTGEADSWKSHEGMANPTPTTTTGEGFGDCRGESLEIW